MKFSTSPTFLSEKLKQESKVSQIVVSSSILKVEECPKSPLPNSVESQATFVSYLRVGYEFFFALTASGATVKFRCKFCKFTPRQSFKFSSLLTLQGTLSATAKPLSQSGSSLTPPPIITIAPLRGFPAVVDVASTDRESLRLPPIQTSIPDDSLVSFLQKEISQEKVSKERQILRERLLERQGKSIF